MVLVAVDRGVESHKGRVVPPEPSAGFSKGARETEKKEQGYEVFDRSHKESIFHARIMVGRHAKLMIFQDSDEKKSRVQNPEKASF